MCQRWTYICTVVFIDIVISKYVCVIDDTDRWISKLLYTCRARPVSQWRTVAASSEPIFTFWSSFSFALFLLLSFSTFSIFLFLFPIFCCSFFYFVFLLFRLFFLFLFSFFVLFCSLPS